MGLSSQLSNPLSGPNIIGNQSRNCHTDGSVRAITYGASPMLPQDQTLSSLIAITDTQAVVILCSKGGKDHTIVRGDPCCDECKDIRESAGACYNRIDVIID